MLPRNLADLKIASKSVHRLTKPLCIIYHKMNTTFCHCQQQICPIYHDTLKTWRVQSETDICPTVLIWCFIQFKFCIVSGKCWLINTWINQVTIEIKSFPTWPMNFINLVLQKQYTVMARRLCHIYCLFIFLNT